MLGGLDAWIAAGYEVENRSRPSLASRTAKRLPVRISSET
jgi:3-mercaptopyruvate sulfurtransferase SseA